MPKRNNKRGTRGPSQKRLTADQKSAQRELAFEAIRRLYAECLPLWRVCGRGFCRRHKTCGGDVRPCLQRGWPLMPEAVQDAAHQEVMRGGPRRVPPATPTERILRTYPPNNFVH